MYLVTLTCTFITHALQTDLSDRLCMGSWIGSAHSSASANTAKTSKSGTNGPKMQFRVS